MTERPLLLSSLAELGLDGQAGLALQLSAYLEYIEQWNPAWGLVGAEGDELVTKHIIDSLAALPAIDQALADWRAARPAGEERAPELADLGTGAGLPGIPLALARPQLAVCLVDRMTRRVKFLELMRQQLPLDNVRIIEQQVEHCKGEFDFITFRAFRPFERKLFKKVFGLCRPGGRIFAYKGRLDKATAELEAIAGLYADVEIRPLKVPFLDDERCLVILTAKA
ncbi:MAG: 16S rRNA (guanine(527)-N(7))-methyltransferase RsmG [Spirochaetes bacterium GWD1_61_31]|nr:MAG: 16S rRNA (guanine(527)-N(7))-methyltransferase RsmG [Spirochaetes bacterium GWB1_60_80]OHD28833.1 MAG: 16S rRNA (guanine(527)-N(7))-methyltransferase RsmG [Spirochaetes bacterium GWC1_61_12]OHD42148.1 MAG: 16S rRNA (guanine(527)-N(7))-methyltransferase RsmG [Spirochaetes bacterium GWD1_61_31]OHD45431.1 MAG: 16S rRNA (guanine(527)-N(7))-methyltransferase RsmG [Spirochaetes bacterium GWE1_60_18]OHD61527.1 MAG: 16S rRNA (guanine(527)-N(7))-methyltransferase RsmG [Spirochaetes bacterium GWF